MRMHKGTSCEATSKCSDKGAVVDLPPPVSIAQHENIVNSDPHRRSPTGVDLWKYEGREMICDLF